jgi:hypothetical protein
MKLKTLDIFLFEILQFQRDQLFYGKNFQAPRLSIQFDF